MRVAIYIAIAVPFFLLSGAYISQYGFGLYPCEMCWWQRYPHLAALFFGIFAYMVPKFAPTVARVSTVLAALSLFISGIIGGFHAGVEYGWWEGITGCAVTADPDADILDAIMNAPLIRCDVTPWELFGISLAGYNFIFSISAALLIIAIVLKSRSKRPILRR